MTKPEPRPSGLRRNHPGIPREMREDAVQAAESEATVGEQSNPAETKPTAAPSRKPKRTPGAKIGRPKGAKSTPAYKQYSITLTTSVWEECRDMLAFHQDNPLRTVKNFRELVDVALMEYLVKARREAGVGKRFPPRGGDS